MITENGQIRLRKNEPYYTTQPSMRYWLLSGRVCIFIVPWFDAEQTINREAGRGCQLVEFSPEKNFEIPSFVFQDPNSPQAWRFCIRSLEDDTVLQIRQGCGKILQRNFLKEVGIDTYEQEGGRDGGFENSLVAFYRKNQVKESAILHSSQKNAQKTRTQTFKAIADSMSGTAGLSNSGANYLHKTVQFAARKAGITNVADEEKVRLSLNGAEMTVAEIARASHFICREITLDMDWYKNDSGVLFVWLPVENGTDAKGKPIITRHPAACYMKGRKYHCYDGETETDMPLTKQLADKLEPKGYSIRRSLPQHALNRKDIISFIRKSIRPSDMVWMLVISLIVTLIGVLLPKMNQMIYDDYIPMGNVNYLIQICIVIISCMMGNIFISIVKSLYEFRIPCKAGYELQDAMYHRIFELPENFFRKFDSAELAQRVGGIGSIANTIFSKLIVNGFALALSIVYWIQMITYSGKLTLISLAMLVVYGALIYFLAKRELKPRREMAEFAGQASGKLYQFISGVDKLRMSGAEERAVLQYSTPVVREKQLAIKTGRNSAILSILQDSGSTIFSMVLYYMMIKSGLNLSMGAFMAFNTAFGAVTRATLDCVQAAVDYNNLKPSMERIKPLLEAEPENDMDKDVISELKGSIDVEGVVFGYNKDQAPVLNGLNIHIKPGEYVAFVGPSGCGKSTLLKLLLGFETPDAGRICYDGKDISSVDKHSLRKHLGVVLQNGKLISGSIYQNITITSPSPNLKKVWQTIDDVGLKADIDNMPMGIHTVLSESAGTISGGQQQRILIARAIYNDPSVLYFDQATSALDNITQAKVCSSLEKRNMTRVVIAHRLSTVRNCDRIIVLNNGKVAEQGNFDQLMALHGQFFDMASRQLV